MVTKSKPAVIVFALTILAASLCSMGVRAGEPLVKDGQKIAFMGDSITQQGAGSPSGFACLVIIGLEANGIKAILIPAGLSGNNSDDMLARIEKDAISKKPDWLTLSCGGEDVWQQDWGKGVLIDRYKQNMTKMVDMGQAAGIKVMLLTSTMNGEDQVNSKNQKLIAYNDFLRELAKEKNCHLADLNADLQAELKRLGRDPSKPGTALTTDGIHMNPEGNVMIAARILKTFGLNDEQIQKAKDKWMVIPGACEFAGVIRLTMRDFKKLREIAVQKKISMNELLDEQLKKSAETILNSKK